MEVVDRNAPGPDQGEGDEAHQEVELVRVGEARVLDVEASAARNS
jgi:hypothetical protein